MLLKDKNAVIHGGGGAIATLFLSAFGEVSP
jgi:hypothetical protein